jgi:hypothetical protein
MLDVIRAGAVTTCGLRHLRWEIDPKIPQQYLHWRQFTRSESTTTYLPTGLVYPHAGPTTSSTHPTDPHPGRSTDHRRHRPRHRHTPANRAHRHEPHGPSPPHRHHPTVRRIAPRLHQPLDTAGAQRCIADTRLSCSGTNRVQTASPNNTQRRPTSTDVFAGEWPFRLRKPWSPSSQRRYISRGCPGTRGS